MYHNEEIINGVLHVRTHPNGPWRALSAEALTSRIEAHKEGQNTLRQDLNKANRRAIELKNKNTDLTRDLSLARVELETDSMVAVFPVPVLVPVPVYPRQQVLNIYIRIII